LAHDFSHGIRQVCTPPGLSRNSPVGPVFNLTPYQVLNNWQSPVPWDIKKQRKGKDVLSQKALLCEMGISPKLMFFLHKGKKEVKGTLFLEFQSTIYRTGFTPPHRSMGHLETKERRGHSLSVCTAL
jgi:hypothetical protein